MPHFTKELLLDFDTKRHSSATQLQIEKTLADKHPQSNYARRVDTSTAPLPDSSAAETQVFRWQLA